jgi:hypothetical protein
MPLDEKSTNIGKMRSYVNETVRSGCIRQHFNGTQAVTDGASHEVEEAICLLFVIKPLFVLRFLRLLRKARQLNQPNSGFVCSCVSQSELQQQGSSFFAGRL